MRVPKHIHVEDLTRFDPVEGSDARLCFTQVYDEHQSATTVERVTIAELRQARDAIDAYLSVHDTFLGT